MLRLIVSLHIDNLSGPGPSCSYFPGVRKEKAQQRIWNRRAQSFFGHCTHPSNHLRWHLLRAWPSEDDHAQLMVIPVIEAGAAGGRFFSPVDVRERLGPVRV